MKSNIVIFLSFMMLSFGCKEKEIDFVSINISSPVKDQIYHDKEVVRIIAEINRNDTSINGYSIVVKDKDGKEIHKDSKSVSSSERNGKIKIDNSFSHSATGSTNVTLEICADLQNGSKTCQSIPFVITK